MSKSKILVEITYANGNIDKKMCPVEGGKVLIRKGRVGQGLKKQTPTLEVDCIKEENFSYGRFAAFWNMFMGTHKKVCYKDGADSLTPNLPTGTPPKYTADFLAKMTDVLLLEKQAKTTGQTTTIQFIILIGMVLIVFMNWVVWAKLGVINI